MGEFKSIKISKKICSSPSFFKEPYVRLPSSMQSRPFTLRVLKTLPPTLPLKQLCRLLVSTCSGKAIPSWQAVATTSSCSDLLRTLVVRSSHRLRDHFSWPMVHSLTPLIGSRDWIVKAWTRPWLFSSLLWTTTCSSQLVDPANLQERTRLWIWTWNKTALNTLTTASKMSANRTSQPSSMPLFCSAHWSKSVRKST